jgi:serine/threonine-protein kinase
MIGQDQQTLQIGTVIHDKWVILEFLGKGGMGEVYRAHQVNLRRDIAIKIISREWLESVEENEDELKSGLQRFRIEVLAMAQVRHPNILQIYDHGLFCIKKDQKPLEFEYIAMEYVPGGTLLSTMSEEGFYPEEELTKEWLERYFLPVLDGVRALHASGIVHRDLKPGNILLDGHTPRIADFGLARSARIVSMTMSTDIKGTPAYMSPEHFMDLKRADHRSDIYSLGKMLFEAIDGKIGPGIIPLKSATLRKTESLFFQELDRIIRKATAEDRNERFDSVEEFQSSIVGSFASIGSGKEIGRVAEHTLPALLSRPKWIWAGVATAVILVLAMTMWHLLGEPGKSAFRKAAGSSAPVSHVKPPDPPNELPAAPDPADPLPGALTGKDDATLYLIPGGQLLPKELSGTSGKPVRVEPFYMDETEVTNHQYVEFLNRVLKRIRVEEGVVKGDGSVWLLLGEVVKGYEPIIFKDGMFVIKDPIYHSHPVVRVTAEGAASYAAHYGRRLPTAAEWFHAEETGNDRRQSASPADSQQPDSHMDMTRNQKQKPSAEQIRTERPFSVTQLPPNRYGVRGLDGNVDEWGTMPSDKTSQAKGGSRYGVLPEGIGRLPWEAFKEVGFRTVMTPAKHDRT